MRKAIILVVGLFVLIASVVVSGAAFAGDKITMREVLPEGIKIGMSYKAVNKVLGDPIERMDYSKYYGFCRALYKVDEDNYMIMHIKLGRVKRIDMFEDMTYDTVLKRFQE